MLCRRHKITFFLVGRQIWMHASITVNVICHFLSIQPELRCLVIQVLPPLRQFFFFFFFCEHRLRVCFAHLLKNESFPQNCSNELRKHWNRQSRKKRYKPRNVGANRGHACDKKKKKKDPLNVSFWSAQPGAKHCRSSNFFPPLTCSGVPAS